MENRFRNRQILLRVTEKESERIRQLADENGLGLGEYLRHLLLRDKFKSPK